MPNMMNFLLGNISAGGFGAPAQDKVRIGTIASLMPSPMTAVVVGRVMGPVAAQQSQPVVAPPPPPVGDVQQPAEDINQAIAGIKTAVLETKAIAQQAANDAKAAKETAEAIKTLVEKQGGN